MNDDFVLHGLSQIEGDFDLIYCDVWGVIHNGREAFLPACDALRRFRERGGAVILVTNAPVPANRVTNVMDRVGVPRDCFDDIATSGEATANELANHQGRKVYAIGSSYDEPVYVGLDLDFTTDSEVADVVSCTGLRAVETEVPEDYRAELMGLAKKGLSMICANPDVQYRYGDRLIWAAGALANLYEEVGGNVVRPGKPDDAIYRLAGAMAERSSSRPFDPSRILVIGDGPETDIRGANRQGLRSVFIGGGIHGAALGDGATFIENARSILDAAGVVATHAMPELAW